MLTAKECSRCHGYRYEKYGKDRQEHAPFVPMYDHESGGMEFDIESE